jgi:hypothetical protein
MPRGNALSEILNHREWESVLGEDIYNPIPSGVSNEIASGGSPTVVREGYFLRNSPEG